MTDNLILDLYGNARNYAELLAQTIISTESTGTGSGDDAAIQPTTTNTEGNTHHGT